MDKRAIMKIAKIRITNKMLAQLLLDRRATKSTLPSDLRILNVLQDSHDLVCNTVTIIVESDSFQELPDGGEAPFIEFSMSNPTSNDKLQDIEKQISDLKKEVSKIQPIIINNPPNGSNHIPI